MLIINKKSIKKQNFSGHGGVGVMKMRFAFTDHQHYGNKNDARWNCFAIAEIPVGATAGLHKHKDTDEIFYILEGKATIVIDGESHEINKEDIVLTLIGSSHDIINVKKKLKFIVVEIFRK